VKWEQHVLVFSGLLLHEVGGCVQIKLFFDHLAEVGLYPKVGFVPVTDEVVGFTLENSLVAVCLTLPVFNK